MKIIEKSESAGADMDLIMQTFGGQWVDPENDTDDRVRCDDCSNKVTATAMLRMPMKEFEKMRKVNHVAGHWFIESAKIKKDWATAQYQQTYCKPTGFAVLPIPHRCHMFTTVPVREEVNWMNDDPAPTVHRAQRADQACDVGASVSPRPAAGGDTEWWA
jgi:hypothetical protein